MREFLLKLRRKWQARTDNEISTEKSFRLNLNRLLQIVSERADRDECRHAKNNCKRKKEKSAATRTTVAPRHFQNPVHLKTSVRIYGDSVVRFHQKILLNNRTVFKADRSVGQTREFQIVGYQNQSCPGFTVEFK